MKKYIFKIGYIMLLMVLLQSDYTVKCYNRYQEDKLVAVPVGLRQSFTERLNLLIYYQQRREWDKLYDILTKRHRDKDTFLGYMSVSDSSVFAFIDFNITNTINDPETLWQIYGCGIFSDNGTIVQLKAHTFAVLHDKQWFFTEEISPDFTSIDGHSIPCSLDK